MGKKAFVWLLVSVGTTPPIYLIMGDFLKAFLWTVAFVFLFWIYMKMENI